MSYVQYGVQSSEGAPLEVIARANRFTLQDLAENRNGRISSPQFFRLFGRALEPVRYTAPMFGGWLMILALVYYVPGLRLMASMMWLFGGSTYAPSAFLAITVFCAGMLLLSVIKSAGNIGLLLVDLSQGKAARIEGHLSPSREGRTDWSLARLWGSTAQNMKYSYVIGQEYFTVDENAHEVELDPRGNYRLYYAPRSKLLLSLERV
jgi:hypothetical protein